MCCYFFFSSRRRHTRSKRDWSSDVCSSDLRDVYASGHPACASSCLAAQAQHITRGVTTRVNISASLLKRVADLYAVRAPRSEERRVGKECRSRRWAADLKEKERGRAGV